MEVQEQLSLEINEQLTGCQFKVLVDHAEGDFWIARTQYDSPEVDNEVLIDRKYKFIKPGQFYQVRIDRVEQFDLFGTPVV